MCYELYLKGKSECNNLIKELVQSKIFLCAYCILHSIDDCFTDWSQVIMGHEIR